MPGFGIMCYCEGKVRGGRERRVFYPELEAAVSAYGGDEVRVDGGREPLYLRLFHK